MSDRLVTEHDAGLLCSDYLLLINYIVLKTDVDCIAVICSRAITLATLLQLLLHYWLHRKSQISGHFVLRFFFCLFFFLAELTILNVMNLCSQILSKTNLKENFNSKYEVWGIFFFFPQAFPQISCGNACV